jgi:carbonic anhydrase
VDPHYAACSTGFEQSPIDINHTLEADLPPLALDYKALGQEVLNNGHTIQVNVAPGSTLTLDGQVYTLKQFHFHAPSEDRVNGESFAMEAHLVHADAEGHLAVVAVLYRLGAENPTLAEVWGVSPKVAETKHALWSPIDPKGLLPKGQDYYLFSGSLTTPPCTEGVRWVVMKEPLTVSQAQVDTFIEMMHGPNNRPLQAVNARPLLR